MEDVILQLMISAKYFLINKIYSKIYIKMVLCQQYWNSWTFQRNVWSNIVYQNECYNETQLQIKHWTISFFFFTLKSL